MHQVYIIAQNTFREAIRSKLLYVLFAFVVLLIVVAALFGSVSIGDQLQVIKNFGLFSLSLAGTLYVTIAGSTMLYKEIQRRTIFNVLARPVTRGQFLLGKFFGMVLSVFLLLIVMGGALVVFARALQGEFDWYLLQAIGFLFLEATLICAVTIFFSAIVVTPLLVGLFSFGVFLAGRSAEFIRLFADQSTSTILRGLLEGLYYITPHFDRLFIADQMIYGIPLLPGQAMLSTLYVVLYCTALLAGSILFFHRRQFR